MIQNTQALPYKVEENIASRFMNFARILTSQNNGYDYPKNRR
ncbi:MAG: hypothetical protein S4CHLAM7_03370 [Chlamydiae bacterium]|nr:hypothetical protein [Chlamydiota bacterium]